MSTDYERVARAIEYVHKELHKQPSLEEIAATVHLSPFHFQRLFRRLVGISPRRYQQNLVAEHAKTSLRKGVTVLDAAYDIGLSGPSRLHDLFVSVESVTPGEYKARGESLVLRFGVHWTPFGPCSLALTERGICSLRFLHNPSRVKVEEDLRGEWPRAELREVPEVTAEIIHRIFHLSRWSEEKPFHLFLQGTNFQIQVWRALLRIPMGSTVSYSQVCEAIGRPGAHARAVANAVGANPIAFLIPCHRVIRESGAIGGYRYGIDTKTRILVAEENGAGERWRI